MPYASQLLCRQPDVHLRIARFTRNFDRTFDRKPEPVFDLRAESSHECPERAIDFREQRVLSQRVPYVARREVLHADPKPWFGLCRPLARAPKFVERAFGGARHNLTGGAKAVDDTGPSYTLVIGHEISFASRRALAQGEKARVRQIPDVHRAADAASTVCQQQFAPEQAPQYLEEKGGTGPDNIWRAKDDAFQSTGGDPLDDRSEEHTSELQSPYDL